MHRSAMHSMGLESLVQRGRSPFYNDLVSLYQESIDVVNELPDPSHGDITLTLKSIRFKERVRALVQKYMGITLSNVIVTESNMVNLMCVMRYPTLISKHDRSLNATPGMLLEQMNRVYDDKSGRLTTSDRKTDLPITFSLVMYTSWWRIHNEDNTPFFTADEIAAAVLHEFGHIDHFIRASMRIQGRTLDAADIISYVQNSPDRDLILELIAKLKKSKYLDTRFLKILKITEDYFRTSNSMDDPQFIEALNTLAAVVAAEDSAWQLFIFNNSLGGGRDKVSTHNQETDAERSADEFPARHGAGQAMVTAMGKIHSLSEDKGNLFLKQFMWSGPALVFGMCLHFTSVFRWAPEEVHQGYDPLIRRLQLIVQTTKHAFHDSQLPEEVKVDLQKQIEQAETYIAVYSSAGHRQARAQMKKWKDDVVRFGRIIASPFQNRLSQDYDRLQNATRSLTRHPLYFLANK